MLLTASCPLARCPLQIKITMDALKDILGDAQAYLTADENKVAVGVVGGATIAAAFTLYMRRGSSKPGTFDIGSGSVDRSMVETEVRERNLWGFMRALVRRNSALGRICFSRDFISPTLRTRPAGRRSPQRQLHLLHCHFIRISVECIRVTRRRGPSSRSARRIDDLTPARQHAPPRDSLPATIPLTRRQHPACTPSVGQGLLRRVQHAAAREGCRDRPEGKGRQPG